MTAATETGARVRGWTLLLRVVLGMVLLAAGVGKLLDPVGFAAVVRSYEVLPGALAFWAGLALALGELVLAFWLLSGRWLAMAAAAALLLHLVYLVWLSLAWARGLDIQNCGCFGVFLARPLTGWTFLEDGLLLLACATLYRLARGDWSVPGRGAAPLALALVLAAGHGAGDASAAGRDGVDMPDRVEAGGRSLPLNGLATRTYSIFNVKVYVAGLYLPEPGRDADAVLGAPGPKAVEVAYLHGVSRKDAAKAWLALLEENCPAVPGCGPVGEAGERFTGLLPAVQDGDRHRFVLAGDGSVAVEVNGAALGRVQAKRYDFGRLLLATFIGPSPTSDGVKRGLLGEE